MENSHEPIISDEIFYRVAEKLKVRGSDKAKKNRSSATYKAPERVNIVAKLLKCGVCNHKLCYHPTVKDSYVSCRIGRLNDKYSCKDTKIGIDKVRAILVESVKKHIDSIVERKILIDCTSNKMRLKSLLANREVKQKELDKWTIRLKELFQNSFDNKIDDDTFDRQKAFISLERDTTEEALESLNIEIEKLQDEMKFEQSFMATYSNITDLTEITDGILTQLIKEVIIYDNDAFEIQWKFNEEIATAI